MNNKKTIYTLTFAVLAPSLMAMSLALSPSQQAQEPATEAIKKKAPEYIGAIACRKCHGDQYKAWKKTNMAQAFENLKPGERAEAKGKAGLDPSKDYTRDETCLSCHVTGFGEPGGYAIPPKGDTPEAKRAQKKAKAMEGVQCESCHGPASLSVAHKKLDEKYKWDDVVKAEVLPGMWFPDEKICLACHNDESPFVKEGYVFDFEKRKEEGTHTHYRMDFDHGCPHKHSVTKKKKRKKKKD
jgi:cytochrome c554/c'-like protein